MQKVDRIAKHYEGKDLADDANEVIELFNKKKLEKTNSNVNSK